MNKSNLSYTKAFEELQTIVSKMENSDITIDELDAKIKRASELLKICQSKLFEAEENIRESLKEISDYSTE